METLSANLHLMMASFYRPTKEKYKIIIEGKAFPSDHVSRIYRPVSLLLNHAQYAVESQIQHHNLEPEDALIAIEPADSTQATLTTSHILSIIDKHASTTALVLLPGVQYYTGQYLDILTITAHAHSHGITIGWDLAHAVGNVELRLHDWNVDFAVWCSYKYLNCGPGAIAGLFVHEKHGQVDKTGLDSGQVEFRHRLSGWWGGDKATRFQMGNSMSLLPQKVPSALVPATVGRLELGEKILTAGRICAYSWCRGFPGWESLCSGYLSAVGLTRDIRAYVNVGDPQEVRRDNKVPRGTTLPEWRRR